MTTGTSTSLGGGEPIAGGGGTSVGGGGTVGGDGGSIGGATASSTPIIAPPVSVGVGGVVAAQITPQITVSTAPAILAAATSSAASPAAKTALTDAAIALSVSNAVQKASQSSSSGKKAVTIGSAAQVIPAATTAAPAAAILSASGATEVAVKSVIQANPAVAAVAIAVEKSSSVNNTEKLTKTATVSDTMTFSNKKFNIDGGIIESDLSNPATFDTMNIEFDTTGISYIGFIHTSESGAITILSQPMNFQGVAQGTVFDLSYGATLTITDVVGTYVKGDLVAPFSDVTAVKIVSSANIGLPVVTATAQVSPLASKFILELGKVTEVSIKKNFDNQLAGGASQDGKNMANASKLPGNKLMSASGAAGNTSNDIAMNKPLAAQVLGGNLSAIINSTPVAYSNGTVTLKSVSNTLSPAAAASSLSFVDPGPATTSVFAAHFAKDDGTLLVGSLADQSTWAPGGVELQIPKPVSDVLILNHVSTSGVVTLLGTITNPAVGPYLLASGTSLTITSITASAIYATYAGPFGNLSITPGNASIPCLVAGTRIATPSGYLPVEQLKSGDKVVTAAGKVVPIKMFQRTIPVTTTATAPYVIQKGAFGSQNPKADVTLSPLHAIQVRRGVWEIPKYAATRYPGVHQKVVGESVTYYHVETPDYFHDNLLIEGGVVVESFAGSRICSQMPAGAKLYRYSAALGGFTRFSPTAAKSLK
jgi:hypothetical protein